MSAGQYVRLFEWDYSKFAVRQRLPALVALIQGSVGKIEEEHRSLSMVFSEKNQSMQVRVKKACLISPYVRRGQVRSGQVRSCQDSGIGLRR